MIEENRGQRAFEVADAGIGAAKRQLASGVDITKYNDPVVTPPAPVNDIQWSAAAGGLTLNDLDEDATTTDSVNFKIKYRSDTEDFLVVSEGDYGAAKRKIEATFEAKPPDINPDADNKGQPLYYTPSSIMIDGDPLAGPVGIKGVSMFTRKDVLIEDARVNPTTAYSYSCFKADYTSTTTGCTNMPIPGTLDKMQGVSDELCDWDSAPPVAGGSCFKVQGQPVGQGNYNTTGRTTLNPNNNKIEKVQDVGFGAEGTICSVPPGSVNTTGTCPAGSGIASAVDGYIYDSTTTPQFIAKELWTPPLDPGANGPVNPTGTITYPFPRLNPNAEYFRDLVVDDPTKGSYWEGQPADPTWGLSTANSSKVAFVDAQGGTVRFNPDPSTKGGTTGAGGSSYKGIIVVWCGDLQQDDNFRGIIFNLYGDDLDGNTQCGNDVDGPSADNVGVYTNNGTSCTCWVYAEGGTDTRAGIILRPGSSADFLPAGVWNSGLPTDAFVGPPQLSS